MNRTDPTEVMKKIARDQALSMIRGRKNMRGAPQGWSDEQWLHMMRQMVKTAREAGVTDDELRAVGFEPGELSAK